jgi:hypothetical protein
MNVSVSFAWMKEGCCCCSIRVRGRKAPLHRSTFLIDYQSQAIDACGRPCCFPFQAPGLRPSSRNLGGSRDLAGVGHTEGPLLLVVVIGYIYICLVRRRRAPLAHLYTCLSPATHNTAHTHTHTVPNSQNGPQEEGDDGPTAAAAAAPSNATIPSTSSTSERGDPLAATESTAPPGHHHQHGARGLVRRCAALLPPHASGAPPLLLPPLARVGLRHRPAPDGRGAAGVLRAHRVVRHLRERDGGPLLPARGEAHRRQRPLKGRGGRDHPPERVHGPERRLLPPAPLRRHRCVRVATWRVVVVVLGGE